MDLSESARKWARLATSRLLAEFSLWSANLLRLEEEIQRTDAYTDMYHLDVSDGHAASRLLFFPDLVARVRLATERILHVHLMVDGAILLDQIDHFAGAGADVISVHADPGTPVEMALERIRWHGKCAGVVISADIAPEVAEPYLDHVEIVTLLGTAVGVKGQSLLPESLPRLERARSLLKKRGLEARVRIGADGGIRRETVPRLRASGADTVVMGSLAFASDDLPKTVAWLRGLPAPVWATESG